MLLPLLASLAVSSLTSCNGDLAADSDLGSTADTDQTQLQPVAAGPGAWLPVDRRQFEVQSPGVLAAHIPGVMHAELTADGLLARADGDELGLRTLSYGRHPLGGAEPTLGDCAPTSELIGRYCAPAAELDHALVTEWWTSSTTGVNQGWTLHAPADPSSDVAELQLSTTAGQLFDVDADGQGAWFTGDRGGLWRYEDLAAWDATGRGLSIALQELGSVLTLVVDVQGARWPVTVDPSLTAALSVEIKVVASDGAGGDYFGYAVSGAGDVDGDGYDDIVVGAPYDDDNGTNSGSVYVYYGTSTGISSSSEDKLAASDAAAVDYFGWSVSGAGDVDGDGYYDLIVGSFYDDDNGSTSGSAYVYYGTSTGISSTPEHKLTASDGAAGDNFGRSVSGAGDVDGDGYDDVVVGARGDDDNGTTSGSAYVYYGTSTGISTGSEDKLLAGDGATKDIFGWSVSGAGDIDADGYDDLVVGAYGDDDGGGNSGSAYVYYGTSTGIAAATAFQDKLVASDAASTDYFGWSVSGAGDVNGDGYDDLVVGAYGADASGETDSGAAYVYYGTSTGISSTSESKLVAEYAVASDYFGIAVSGAGDVDGDGYDDVWIGADHDTTFGGTNSGSAFVYYGTITGVSVSSEDKVVASDGAASDYFGWSVSDAGDVDGDGYDDVVAGAWADDDNGSISGSVYVYSGGCRGDEDGDGSDCDEDCDDADANTYPGAAFLDSTVDCMTDADADGYGDDSPATGVTAGTDCNDADAIVSPSATEISGDEEDQDCDGTEICYADADDDGYTDGASTVSSTDTDCTDAGEGTSSDPTGECDDADATVNPGATELTGDAVDQDCDGTEICYADADDDSYTDGASTVSSADTDCADSGEGTASDPTGECDDSDADTYPGAAALDSTTDCMTDADADGYGDDSPATGVTAGTDCNDADATILPGATELTGDEVDQNCDGTETCYVDADDDGYTDGSSTVASTDSDCSDTGEGTASDPTGECNDADALVNPGATEIPGDEVDQDCDGTETCYADADDDGYTDGSSTVSSTDTDCTDSGEGLATDNTGECDDSDADTYPGAASLDSTTDCMTDADADGYGDDSPATGVSAGTDCNDADATIRPGATELTGDGVDQDCDGMEICYVDADGDGYTDGSSTVSSTDQDCADGGEGTSTDPTGECDDADATVNPGATESAGDEVDQDCDGSETCYADADDDGYTDGSSTVSSTDTDCSDTGEGTSTDPTGECNDADATVNPGATELTGDEVDQDCDGAETCYADADDDGYTDGSSTIASADEDCVDSGEGTSSDPTGECNDADATVNPGATETIGDEVDQDCDGTEMCYADADADGYTDGTSVTSVDSDCSDAGEASASIPNNDCDDTDSEVNPAAVELPYDGIDNDCSDGDACDLDGDGLDSDLCASGTDCNDRNALSFPGAVESCDGQDNDCDSDVDESTSCSDDDGDGFAEDGGDCDDTDPNTHPGALEECDGQDDNCNDVVDENTSCSDDDGDGYSEEDGDCNDSDADVSPDVLEIDANGVDDNCDGTVDEGGVFTDTDGDGFSPEEGDCNDESADIHPAAQEVANRIDDNCDGRVDEDTDVSDDDLDGYSEDGGDCDDSSGWIFPGATEICDDVDNNCDGVIDEDCGEDVVAPETGCSTSSPPTGLVLLGLLMLLLSRRAKNGARA